MKPKWYKLSQDEKPKSSFLIREATRDFKNEVIKKHKEKKILDCREFYKDICRHGLLGTKGVVDADGREVSIENLDIDALPLSVIREIAVKSSGLCIKYDTLHDMVFIFEDR